MRHASLWMFAVLACGASGAQEEESPFRAYEERLARAAERADAVTVTIRVERDANGAISSENQYKGQIFGRRPSAPVTGTIIDKDGFILTSFFNVKEGHKKIEVTLADGDTHEAKLLGYHQGADIALLKIPAENLSTLTDVSMSEVKTGQMVVAVGRGPDGKRLTINPGILSAPGRLANRGLQVDAKLNFGNVGGPLIDLNGRLIGVTCKVDVKYAPTYGQNSGVGFAMRIDELRRLLPELKAGLKVTGTGQAFLGVQADITATDIEGVRLAGIQPGTPAELAGLQVGDIIIGMDGRKITTFNELRVAIIAKKVGDPATFRFVRDGKEHEVEVILSERPGE
ncbi:MAG: trypsin-like peptidase domain-containing protein [Planctomycetes bacterium]|nr:trypsin-like peptidase domain-containing protein [Planctomycetota bacterium]